MAYFYKGFTFEQDFKRRLTVEGNAVSDDQFTDDKTLVRSARKYIDNSGEVEIREVTRAEHLKILRKGSQRWNKWRREHPEIHPMLACYDFSQSDSRITLDDYDFSYTNLTPAKLKGMSLRRANFHQAILAKADLRGARLQRANFCRTDLYETNLERARLRGANLQGVQLARTILKGADLRGCRIYGLSAWDVKLKHAKQSGLEINYEELVGGGRRPQRATVDGVDVASFMYYTLNNKNIAQVINATKSQWILLLGRFAEGHKDGLNELAERLRRRRRNYIPIIFDFEPARKLDLIESVILLAGLSGVVIADITDPRSTPLELYAILSHLAVPVVPIIKAGEEKFGVWSGLLKFPWLHDPPIAYEDLDELDAQLDTVLDPLFASQGAASVRAHATAD